MSNRHRQTTIFCAALMVIFHAVNVLAQPDTTTINKSYNLNRDVVVTGSRLPNDGTNPRHTVIVINRADIERSAARSIEELLQTIAGVDVRQRGAMGVQSDVSIRGGTFEQTLVLVDGIKMMDAQTGHHNFNVPLVLDDIERIEVLKGPASRQYGPNAFSGAINILTRKHKETFARLQAMGGQYGLWELSLSASAPVQLGETRIGNRFSVSRRKADGSPSLDSLNNAGSRTNTDFDILTVSGNADVSNGEAFSLEAGASYIEKKFGANSFYSVRFPTQYEETKTLLTHLTAKINGAVPLTARVYWRRNTDYFILRRENPSFYRNNHESNTYGAEAQAIVHSVLGATVIGGEAALDTLQSSNLGARQRTRLSLFAEHQWKPLENFTVEFGATALWNRTTLPTVSRIDNRTDSTAWIFNLSPSVDIGWQVNETIALRASVGQSFRVPTYTDLYYRDPSNIGNSSLVPETAWTYELGASLHLPFDWVTFQTTAAFFQRNASQLIDFVRLSANAPWTAQNISSAVTNGVDLHSSLLFTPHSNTLSLERVQASYTFIDARFSTETGLQSKYVLDNLHHHGVIAVDLLWLNTVRNQWRIRYEERLGFTGNTFVDARAGATIGAFEVYAEVSNLFNNTPNDLSIVGLPIVGRWMRLGAACNLASLIRR